MHFADFLLFTKQYSVLQIRRDNRDDLGKISHIPRRDGSNEGSQRMFSLRYKKNYL